MPKPAKSKAISPTVRATVQPFLSVDDGRAEATREKHHQALTHVVDAWGRRRVTSLTIADGKAIASKIRKSGLAATTAAKRLQTIKTWGQWLVDSHYLNENPFLHGVSSKQVWSLTGSECRYPTI